MKVFLPIGLLLFFIVGAWCQKVPEVVAVDGFFNTKYDETHPVIAPDGQTLYFS